ncbi:hypothetical protein BDF20DRAFT_678174 [Mycotypha africana]|uniref:uncharacterized protein n=1 Tax=Mycotypha africana TaxID=64632 RepID=UPI002301947A|nr:uncharacterized protein BDF20DRAFT_678174 [Mycotypha africana]KAI8971410.1 hypothetical protein BDF20DRAFT_678174 [Mycotypha africana]
MLLLVFTPSLFSLVTPLKVFHRFRLHIFFGLCIPGKIIFLTPLLTKESKIIRFLFNNLKCIFRNSALFFLSFFLLSFFCFVFLYSLYRKYAHSTNFKLLFLLHQLAITDGKNQKETDHLTLFFSFQIKV